MTDKDIDEVGFGGILPDYPYTPLMKFIGEELYVISVVNKDNVELFKTLQESIFKERFTSLKIAVRDFTKDISVNPDKLDMFYRFVARVFAFPGFEHEVQTSIQGAMVLGESLPEPLKNTVPDPGAGKIDRLLFFMAINSSILEYYITKKALLFKGV